MMGTMIEKTLTSETVYSGKVIDVERDEIELCTGRKSIREVVRHSGGVVIVAVKDSETIFMVKQFRYPLGAVSLELPAGKLEKGEDPNEACKRELSEETGCTAETWTSLGFIYPTPGFCDEKLYLYKAEKLTCGKSHPDEGEIIEFFEYKLDDVFSMIKNGEINDSKTICALMRAFKL